MASPPRHPSPPTLLRPRDAIGFSKRRSSPLHGVKALGSFLPALTRKAFEKYGFSTAALVTDWVMIAGRELAASTAPERLKWPRGVAPADAEGNAPGQGRRGATLVLRVDGGLSLDVQHKARQIIERINAYFGYAAVAELRIVQGPVGAEPRSATTATPAPRPASRPLTVEVAQVADPGLRDALARLGAEVKAGR
jgi:hypothetical protein